jgi:hypothetical protein
MVTRLAVLALAVVLTSLLATLSARTQAQPLTGSAKDFERAQFDDPTHIDNKWLPLRPGTQLVLEGSAIPDEGGRQPRHVVSKCNGFANALVKCGCPLRLARSRTRARLASTYSYRLLFFT